MPQLAATPRKVGGKTADERRAERWRQLVQAGVQIYGERGYRNATVKAVCEAANLTERYFYESFTNSEDLLCACFQEGADELILHVRRAGVHAGGPPMARIRAGVMIYLKTLQTNPAGARVFLIEMSSVSARADALVSRMLDRFGALLVDFLAAGHCEFREPPPLLLRGAIGGGLQIAQAWIASGYAEPIETVADTILQFYGLVARHMAGPDPEAGTSVPARPNRRKPMAPREGG